MSLIMTITMLVGCGDKENTLNEGKKDNKEETENKTKVEVTNLSTSYVKYLEEKSKSMDKLQNLVESSDNYLFPLAMLPLAIVDLAMIPASICGLDEEEAIAPLAILFNDIDYKRDGNNCTVTYKNADGSKSRFESQYDLKTDSASMMVYDENDELNLVSEYSKIKDGYAAQYYLHNDDGTTSLFKSIFSGENIYSSAFENIDKPTSIFKNNKIDAEFAQGGTTWYIEILGDVSKATFEGEEINLDLELEE